MEKIRKILKIIIYPPLPAAVTFLVLSFIYLAAVMFNSIEGVPAYLAYFMSAAGVYYLIAACIIPIVKKIYSDDVVSSYFYRP